MFFRDYMDYHSDRFEDFSLMVYKGERLSALLPANILQKDKSAILQSHGGLTYGGFILPKRHFDAVDLLNTFDALRDFSIKNGIIGLDYKILPDIYAEMPSEEDRYALFRQEAELTECNLSATIRLSENPGFNTLQKRNLKKAENYGFKIIEDCDITQFHTLLENCLAERHNATPVHTAEELERLKKFFPENIEFYGVEDSGKLIAGICIYLSKQVAHAQYICSSAEGRDKGALTLLFNRLISKYEGSCRYFDFGISNEDHGLILNEGLYRQKSALGGSGVAYERYYLDYTR